MVFQFLCLATAASRWDVLFYTRRFTCKVNYTLQSNPSSTPKQIFKRENGGNRSLRMHHIENPLPSASPIPQKACSLSHILVVLI